MLKAALGLDKRGYCNKPTRYNSKYSGLADALKSSINKLLEVLRDEKVRAVISSLFGDLVPNAEREWLDLRLHAMLEDPELGEITKKILMVLLENECINTREISSMLNIDESKLKQCIQVMQDFKLIEINYNDSISIPYSIKSHYAEYIRKKLVRGLMK